MSRWQIAADIDATQAEPARRRRSKRPGSGERKAEKARLRLESQGVSIAAFAREHGLDRMTVCDVLRGKTKGLRGAAHDAAVALGLKRGVRRAEAR